MHIDWLTVVAQIINFIILVWLLKRFLYQPIIHAMDRREQGIADHLEDAALRERTAMQTTVAYERKMEELERDRNQLLQEAAASADAKRRELLDEARGDVADQRTHWQRQVADEKADFLRRLKHQAAASIQTIARRALDDLADTELEEKIIAAFIRRLKSMNEDMRRALATCDGSVDVATSFVLDPSVRGRITRALDEHVGEHIEVVYRESPNLLCGVELTISGWRLSWTLAEYLQELEQRVGEQLETTNVPG